MNIYPATFHGRVADQRKSPLSQVMSPTSSRPKQSILKTSSSEELSLPGIFGQIRIKYRKDLSEKITKILSPKMWRDLEKLAEKSYIQSQMHSDYDSAESIAESDLEDGELRKMVTSPLYMQDREDCMSSRKTTALEKPAMIQDRGVSAKRTQADRREGLMSNSSQETRASEKPAAMFFTRKRRTGKHNQEFYFQKR